MTRSIDKKNILIIAEGKEEKEYLEKILNFPIVNKNIINTIKVINAKGCGNIATRYQYYLSLNIYDVIFVFCDADKGCKSVDTITNKIGCEVYNDMDLANDLVLFANPVTLQIVLLHFGDVMLHSQSKTVNSKVVSELTGVENYSGKDNQIKEIINKITFKSYKFMKERLSNISTIKTDIPSSNFLKFLDNLESDNPKWINDLIKRINKI